MVVLIPSTRIDIDKDMSKLLLVKEINAYVKCDQQYRQNKAKMYSVTLRKCTEAMENYLEGEESYKNIDKESDVIYLLLIIETITYSFDSKSYPVLEIYM